MPLKAPRFVGDQVLENCLAGKSKLTLGSTGAAVARVQKALLDLKFKLPRFGVDDKFGPETASAVREFQKSKKLALIDGVVGPATMQALDDAFANEVNNNSAPLGSGLPANLHWGIDTAAAADFSFKKPGGGTQTLFDLVVNVTGSIPEFWGRYIFNRPGSAAGLTKKEAQFIFSASEGKTRILPVANFANGVYNGSREQGRALARSAIRAASGAGVPNNVWIYADIEPEVDKINPEWFLGWWEGMFDIQNSSMQRGRGGLYIDPRSIFFQKSYRTALKKSLNPLEAALNPDPQIFTPDPPHVARMLWAQRPLAIPPGSNRNSAATKPAGSIPFAPNQPSFCPGMTGLWQYAVKFFLIPGPPPNQNSQIDMDMATDQAFEKMWKK